MTDISVWYKNLPIFTKYWLSLTVGISLLARFGILQGYWLHLSSEFIFHKFQVRIYHPKSVLNCVGDMDDVVINFILKYFRYGGW